LADLHKAFDAYRHKQSQGLFPYIVAADIDIVNLKNDGRIISTEIKRAEEKQ